jgi:hypothetical protein
MLETVGVVHDVAAAPSLGACRDGPQNLRRSISESTTIQTEVNKGGPPVKARGELTAGADLNTLFGQEKTGVYVVRSTTTPTASPTCLWRRPACWR